MKHYSTDEESFCFFFYKNASDKKKRDYMRARGRAISAFFCGFRSRYRQPGRITRLYRLWQDGLLHLRLSLCAVLPRLPTFMIVRVSCHCVLISTFDSKRNYSRKVDGILVLQRNSSKYFLLPNSQLNQW